jgi:broad specificity phosphatase PhoE
MLPLRRLEIRRHAERAEDGSDRLSPEGIERAYAVGRGIRVGYTHLYTSGAQRATQTIACMLAGMGRLVPHGVAVRPGLASPREAEWKEAVRAAGTSSLADLLKVAETLVKAEATRLTAEIQSLLAELPEGAYALAIGHSPITECAAFGVTGKVVLPLGYCEGVLIIQQTTNRYNIERLALT